jgi:hypothetical protein
MMSAMKTRKQVFEERNSMKIHYLDEDGVIFINYPVETTEDGMLLYDMPTIQVAQQIVKEIPKHLRAAITVDFDKIPAWEMREKILEKSYGGALPTEHIVGEAEQKLLELMGIEE